MPEETTACLYTHKQYIATTETDVQYYPSVHLVHRFAWKFFRQFFFYQVLKYKLHFSSLLTQPKHVWLSNVGFNNWITA